MATKDFLLEIFEPDGTTPREDYTETIGLRGDEEMVIRDFTFTAAAVGGLGDFSFTIYQSASVATTEGDIINASWDGTLRYFGKIDSISPDYSDTGTEYEDKHLVRGRGRLAYADGIVYSLSESDGGAVTTTVQDLLDDLFDGGGYSGKGQDNNQPIESALNLITYTTGNNTVETLAINVSYKDTPAAEVWRDCLRLSNGNIDLESVEPYISYLKTNEDMITKQRATGLLETFNIDDGNYPTKNSVDIADDGYRVEVETSGIYNKFILNGTEITSLQYGSNVTASRSTFDTRTAPPLDNPNISVTEAQKWLDGFILDLLTARNTYYLKLRRETHAMSPPFFSGSTDIPDGYIKLTEGAGASEVFTAAFQSATYRLDSGGWHTDIVCGGIRPNIAARSRILTEFTGFGSYSITGNTSVLDPSDSADDTTFNGIEIFDDGEFRVAYENPQMPITVANVAFKVYATGGGFYLGGSVLKTFTSGTTPTVRKDGDIYKCGWYNSTGSTGRAEDSGTIYGIGLPNDAVYTVQSEITINVNGEDHVIKDNPVPFKLKAQPTSDKANDSYSRMPDAEKKNKKEYTPVATLKRAEFRYFADTGGAEAPPDAGSAGWFITDDSIAGSWTRMTGAFSGTSTGTTNGSFTVDSDDSEGSFIYFNAGTGGASLRYNISSTVWQVDHDDGGGWVSLATGTGTKIAATFGGEIYELEVNAADGSLTYKRDTGGTPSTKLKVDLTGTITTYDAIAPAVDGQDDLGDATHNYANAFIGNVTYTQDIVFTPDGGSTVDGTLEVTSNKVFAEGIAFGFEDDD